MVLHYTGFVRQTIRLASDKRHRCDNAPLPGDDWSPAPSPVVADVARRRRATAGQEDSMSLMVVYIILLFFGQAGAVLVGIALDNISKALGLAVFLGLYFAVFIVCWKLAIRLTEPGGLIHSRLGR
jgi:hypothetical protein